METGHRSQHEKSKGASKRQQQKPIWNHFTAYKPAKTKVSRKIATRTQTKKMSNNPLLTNKCVHQTTEEKIIK